jgi:hypothetical protein
MPVCHERLAASVALALLAGCAVLPPEIPESADCRARYLALDEKTDAAGMRDAGVHVIPGFPYVRSNRFLASFRSDTAAPAAFNAWVELLRRLDLEARGVELRNLGTADPEGLLRELDHCGREWATRDLSVPARRAQLRESAAVPDDYSAVQRFFGFYPVAVPLLNLGIDRNNDKVREDYAQPLSALDSPGPLVLWSPQPAEMVTPAEAARWLAADTDPLGIPRLGETQWQRLAAAYAPSWWVETSGDFDWPGTPLLSNGAPVFDTGRPVTHFMPSYTRFGGKVLVQLVYTVWFSERPRQSWIDPYAGLLDGVMWRVTLDTDGRPLLYDSIHACGCYHYYFPAKPLTRRPQESVWQEPVLFPQETVPEGRLTIRLQSRTHYVRRVVASGAAAATEAKTYALADYRELLNLSQTAGRTRSLFSANGIARGTERLERFWLWPSGVPSPGATRQWGRHATSFVGRSHFDDPDLLDRLFMPEGALNRF